MNNVAIVFSGGVEVISASIVEELLNFGVDVAIISIVKKSILRDVNCIDFLEIDWPPKDNDNIVSQIRNFAKKLGAKKENKVAIFATEDGGLRFFIENKEKISDILSFGHAEHLPMGGLDKAELFNCLRNSPSNLSCIVETVIIESPDELRDAVNGFAVDCIVKPSIKPFSMNMHGMKGKAIEISIGNVESGINELEKFWKVANKWVVQPKLITPSDGEFVVWFVRGRDGYFNAMSATELWKQPKVGGTGCLVKSLGVVEDDLALQIKNLLEEIGFVGVGEIPFLLDSNGRLKLIELNARPWLQVGLGCASGMPFAHMLFRVLNNDTLVETHKAKEGVTWVNLERALISSFSREYGAIHSSIYNLIVELKKADVIAIWSSKLKNIRLKWVRRMIEKILF